MAEIVYSNMPIRFMHVQTNEQGQNELRYRREPIPGALYFGVEWENDYNLQRHLSNPSAAAHKFLDSLESAFQKVKHSVVNPEHSVVNPDRSAYVYWHKPDGSLINGYETVTQPMTFDAMNLFLSELQDKEIDSDTSKGTAGLHIHVNKGYFSDSRKIANVIALVSYQQNFFRGISGRKEDQMHWCAFEPNYKYGERAYGAVNVGHDHTIEFRFFNTTRKPYIIKQYIHIIKAICEFANSNDNNLFSDKNRRQELQERWFAFVRSREKNFRSVIRRLKNPIAK